MEVLASESAKRYVKAHGGTAYVRARRHHCCTGPLTLLDITTKPPRDLTAFESIDANEFDVRFCGGQCGRPNQLVIELRGLFRRHPVAFWDGCAFKL
ncbi:MAG: hypothetical protein ACLPVF_10635 [Acidimicrobiales bacterium]